MAGARIERGQAVTVRRLFDEVQWAVEGRAAGGAVDQRQMCAHEECPPVDAGSSSSRWRLSWSCRGPRSPPSPSRTSLPGAGLERLVEPVREEWQRVGAG